ncbi:progonadoliberin-1-like [Pholidichthys leucotaenia]
MHGRMAAHMLAVWLLLMGTVFPLGRCQHWSYGLSPGGKRDLDSFSDTLENVMEEFPHINVPCSVFGCTERSPFAKIYRLKDLLGSVTERESGHRTYKK